jgi:hypothetical protein
MPQVLEVDITQGISPDHAKALISQGFTCLPKVTMGPGTAIAVAGSAPVRVVDLWVGPDEPMIPQSFIAGLFVSLKQSGEGDWVTRRIWNGKSLKELEKRVTITPHPDGEAGGQRDESVVGKSGDADGTILRFPGQGVDGG